MPWPTREWPLGPLPDGVDLDDLMAEAFDPEGPVQQTYAVAIVHRGRLVFERYDGLLPQWDKPGKPVVQETPLLSWSMAKSMLHAIVGMLTEEGKLVLDDPARCPSGSHRTIRGQITLQQLLEMRDGLNFLEEYEDPEQSDVLQMLFGKGQQDMATFAADRPLAVPPGTRFNYSSGTSNIVSGIVAQIVGHGDPYRQFLADRLFSPIGMTSASVTLDDVGTSVGASYVYATARDYARFGLLYLRDGVWEGRKLLPAGWVDHGRKPRSVDPDDGAYYGSHWWTRTTPAAVLGGRARRPVHRHLSRTRSGAGQDGPHRSRALGDSGPVADPGHRRICLGVDRLRRPPTDRPELRPAGSGQAGVRPTWPFPVACCIPGVRTPS